MVNAGSGRPLGEPDLPPVAGMAVATMALVVAGGIILAAYLPNAAPLRLPSILLAAGALILIINVASLFRVRLFAWKAFWLVAKWALLAYVVIAGMLEFIFILDRTPIAALVQLSLTLVIFAVDVPLLFAFSVARHQPASLADTAAPAAG